MRYIKHAFMFFLFIQSSNLLAVSFVGSVVVRNLEATTVAAESGDANAQYDLANRYSYGYGVPQNYENAIVWLRKSAAQQYPDAQLMLGKAFEFGYGVIPDYQQAIRWYQKALESYMKADQQGDIHAKISIGHIYKYGLGVQQNDKQALFWYQQAHAQYQKTALEGNVEAECGLGRMYLGGELEKDTSMAIEWLNKAAMHGHAESQLMLGNIYFSGLDVQISYFQAYIWYSLLAFNRDADIINWRNEVANELTSEQLKDAQIKIQEYQRKIANLN